LKDPYAIVSFMTDGIVSTRPLDLGALLRKKDADDVQLGDWEVEEVKDGFFLMSGVYSYIKEVKEKDGSIKEVTFGKSRGFDPRNFLLRKDMMQFFLDDVLPVWRKPFKKEGDKYIAQPLTYRIRRYITLGEACASKERFKLIGRWADVPREIDVTKPGPKRDMDADHPWTFQLPERKKPFARKDLPNIDALESMRLWFDIEPSEAIACLKDGEPLRCRFLVPTIPAENPTPQITSAPSLPDWLEDVEGVRMKGVDENPSLFDLDEDTGEIGAGFC
jgi:hypothetical protein